MTRRARATMSGNIVAGEVVGNTAGYTVSELNTAGCADTVGDRATTVRARVAASADGRSPTPPAAPRRLDGPSTPRHHLLGVRSCGARGNRHQCSPRATAPQATSDRATSPQARAVAGASCRARRRLSSNVPGKATRGELKAGARPERTGARPSLGARGRMAFAAARLVAYRSLCSRGRVLLGVSSSLQHGVVGVSVGVMATEDDVRSTAPAVGCSPRSPVAVTALTRRRRGA
jgi:hypothetical protein